MECQTFSVVDDRDSTKVRRTVDVVCLCGGRRAVGKFRGDRKGATAIDVDPETNRNTEERGQRRRGVARAIRVKTVEVTQWPHGGKRCGSYFCSNAEAHLCEQQCDSQNGSLYFLCPMPHHRSITISRDHRSSDQLSCL